MPILALLGACATVAPDEGPSTHVPQDEAAYFQDPLAGYPLAAHPEAERRTRQAFAALRSGGDLTAADADMAELLIEDPGFHPARVVRAQIAVALDEFARARELLSPVADELPDYLACQLLLGRVADRMDDLPAAFHAYRRASPWSSVARDRAAELEPRVTQIYLHRITDLIDRYRIEDAKRELATLEEWAADRISVLRIRRDLAFAEGDVETEIEVLKRLLAYEEREDRPGEDRPGGDRPGEGWPGEDWPVPERAGASPRIQTLETNGPGGGEDLRERLADLYLVSGEIRAAIDVLEQLAPERRDDARWAEKLERSKFLWRLQLLPEHVQEVASKGVLSRSDLATLLYWLVPSVRYSEVSDPPIATDILDHPRREEILPVMSLGLIAVDETLHRFSPDTAATRALTLASLLGLLQLSDDVACLTSVEAEALPGSWSFTCRKAADCRLIPEAADCLPQAEISGADALDLFRRALDLMAPR